MSVSVQDAATMLAEFIAQRGPVVKVKRGQRSNVKLPSLQPDLLAKAEFEPDNSRIGRESRGIQTRSKVALMVGLVSHDELARLMVREWIDGHNGDLPQAMVCTVI